MPQGDIAGASRLQIRQTELQVLADGGLPRGEDRSGQHAMSHQEGGALASVVHQPEASKKVVHQLPENDVATSDRGVHLGKQLGFIQRGNQGEGCHRALTIHQALVGQGTPLVVVGMQIHVVTDQGNLLDRGSHMNGIPAAEMGEEIRRLPVVAFGPADDHDGSDIGSLLHEGDGSASALAVEADPTIVLVQGVPSEDDDVRLLGPGLHKERVGSADDLRQFICGDREMKIGGMKHFQGH